MTLVDRITAYMRLKNYIIFDQPGEVNIVYLEGMNADGTLNRDEWDKWNDRCVCFTIDPATGKGVVLLNVQCTTEPGKTPTFSPSAAARGGVFRIKFGQYLGCWVDGYHKRRKDHPALVQAPGAVIVGHRDKNRDGMRTGDVVAPGWGINQHGTRPGFVGALVGYFSEGCLVRRYWSDHLHFVRVYRSDPRYIADNNFAFSSTIIAADDLAKHFPYILQNFTQE